MKRFAGLGLLLCCALGATQASDSPCRVRFAHGWLHDAALDVSFDWGPIIDGLGFAQVSDYVGIEPTKMEVIYSLPGSDTALWRKWMQFGLSDHTVLALGDGPRPYGVRINDDNTLPAEGQARLKLVAASNRVPKLAAEATGPGGTWRFGAFGPGQASNYISVPAGPYQVKLHTATEEGGLGPRLKTIPPVPLADRCVYTGFAIGAADVPADNPRHLRLELRLDAAPED